MGTPEFARTTLEILSRSRHKVVGVFTQPDRPTGRGKVPSPPPVKKFALSLNIPVYQPATLKDKNVFDIITTLNPDIIIVVAFGHILPTKIINYPRFKSINLHASLLPKYRGAAPINWALIRGETETGLTVMLMDKGLDTGDILLQEKISISLEDNAMTLHDKIAALGPLKILETLDGLETDKIISTKQEHVRATYAPKLNKKNGLINWENSAINIFNLIRGAYKWPGAYTFLRNKRLKILKALLTEKRNTGKPALILGVGKKGIEVAAKEGVLIITKVQLEGKQEMGAYQFTLGHQIKPGEYFCDSSR